MKSDYGVKHTQKSDPARKPYTELRTIGTRLYFRDRLRHWGYRWGIGRMSSMVNSGLYRIGNPDEKSPVLVSANYRMSFDILRSVLTGRQVWILVLDTKGINVWCAAGKGTFGTQELVKQVIQHKLKEQVSHRQLIVPQLGAPGVAAHLVKKATGFTVHYGPIRAQDLPAFLDHGKATPEMRQVTFKFFERLAVVPMELIPAFLPILLIAMGIALAAGLKTGMVFLLLGLLAPVAVPAFHDWLPGTWLSVKGMVWGSLSALAATFLLDLPIIPGAVLTISLIAISAYTALNFTGATTYTPVNGVKREMRRMLPWIISSAGLGLAGWIFIAVRRFLA